MHLDEATTVSELAAKHGVSDAAVRAALAALVRGNGRQAQFDHPELGGLGQWSSGGMLMIGEMFNNGLKAKVAALVDDLLPLQEAAAARDEAAPSSSRWPAELGRPSSTGSQNDMHYAIFPETRRLAVEDGGKLTLYALGHRQITGVGQQQSGTRSLTFTGPDGSVSLDDLERVSSGGQKTAGHHGTEQNTLSSADTSSNIEAQIDRLHDLVLKGALTQHEFDEAKRKLLDRL